ncbi:WD40 repeat domain-containing protein [Geodermatophilus pulveris]|uniref:WD40 repeat domain-containing protein n=1 Tax=Geodermatophilus pulveris TaxID=1564159 RepID=UPI000B79ACD7|nr:WD40 repeat domain-containing protein [Geodermatophilus pulveris]
MDESGARLALAAADATVQVWDTDERRMLNRIIAPDGEGVVASTPDGYLLTVGSGAGENLHSWHLSRNAAAGSMALHSATAFDLRAAEVWMHVDGTDDQLPQTIAITAQG